MSAATNPVQLNLGDDAAIREKLTAWLRVQTGRA